MFETFPLEVPVDPELVTPDDRDDWDVPELSEAGLAAVGELIERVEARRPVRTSKKARAVVDYYDALEARLAVPSTPEELDARGVLARAASAQAAVNTAEAELLAAACQWADLHRTATWAGPGGERLVCPGGDGTPEVGEFCPAELAAVLGVTCDAARDLISDALDRRHRFPLLWRRLPSGEVKPWVCRRIAVKSRELSQVAAGRVDAEIVDKVDTVSTGRLLEIVAAEIAKADPAKAKAAAEQIRKQQGVWISRKAVHGHATLVARAPAVDLLAVDVTVDEIARAMSVLGDTDSHDIRRAKALALMANPQGVLDLIRDADQVLDAGQDEQPLPGAHDGSVLRRRIDLGRAVVYVHLTDTTLLASDGTAVVRVQDIGPVLKDQIREWLGHRQVTIRPVIDLPGIRPVDCYEVPAPMAAAIRLRTPASPFPYSANISRVGDNDHTEPYIHPDDGGPPGQTRPDNLGRMTRREHRIKTHAGWGVFQPRNGCWIWSTPHGYQYLVDEHGTHPLGRL